MAQTAPPLPGEGTPRPLPRGSGRPLRTRDTRPRFQPLDAVWMLLLAALFAGLAFFRGERQPLSVACLVASTATVALTYLLGWRASGRPAGVIAAALLAVSGTYLTDTFRSLPQDLFALLTLSSLFAFVAGSSLAALALAAVAVWLRPDSVLLGLLLLTFTLTQHRRRAWLGAVLFLVPTVLAVIYVSVSRSGHTDVPRVTLGFHPGLWAWLAAPATLFASWFLLPFFGEMADPVRRARWLPLVLWTVLYAVSAPILAVSHTLDTSTALTPFLPLWFLLIGAGLARLLPVMTGDLPIPALRYAVATLAVISLLLIRARTEWPLLSRHTAASVSYETPPAVLPPSQAAAPPAPLPALPPAILAPKLTPAKPIIAHHRSAMPESVKAVTAQAKNIKPAVRQYVFKNGRMVRRSKWAIQWDLTHPHP